MDNMIYYQGSLTEPGCDEDVTWLVNMDPIEITEDQVGQLRGLLSQDTVEAGGNYRNI